MTGSGAMSMRTLTRATLQRQLLLQRADVDLEQAVRTVVALQAQAPASAHLALHARVSGFDADAMDAAVQDGSLIKATLMRITLHLVSAADHPVFFAAMQPTLRSARLGDRRLTGTGLDAHRADDLTPQVLALFTQPHSNGEAAAAITDRLGLEPEAARWLWWALRQSGPFRHHPTGGPWNFSDRPSHVVAQNCVPHWPTTAQQQAEALATLVRRYLAGFGPASIADIAQFALVQRGRAREAVQLLGAEVVRREGPAGELLDLAQASLPDPDTPTPPRLLPMWDSILLAHHDRTRVLPQQWRRVIIRSNGDTLPAVLVDGQVAGLWRGILGSSGPSVEVTAFEPWDEPTWEAVGRACAAVLGLLAERDPEPYRRYHRWWPVVSAEVAELTRGRGPQLRVFSPDGPSAGR